MMRYLLEKLWIRVVLSLFFILQTRGKKEFPHKLFHRLMKNYNMEEWPSYQAGEGIPTRVYIEIYIVAISSIDASSMDYSVDFYLTQHWNDPRLHFDADKDGTKILELHQLRQIKKLWLPDPYLINAKKAYFHEVTQPNRFLRITQEGNVTYNSRLTATLTCQMELNYYPMDTQECSIYLETYGYSTEILYFHWHWDKSKAFTINSELKLPQFLISGYTYKEGTDEYSMGHFSYLKVFIKFQRQVSYHLIQTYLPTFLIVSISWVSFWLSVEAVPARVSLGITTLLTMTTLISGAKQGLPAVSYIKALDVWMGTCTFFVFATLLEYVIVSKTSRKKVPMLVPRPRQNSNHMSRSHTLVPSGSFEYEMPIPESPPPHETYMPPMSMPAAPPILSAAEQAKRIDVIARILFPSLFGAFNFVYWTYYMLQSYDRMEEAS
ncbi:glycine receptor subunit alpha-4-like isoform X2 [Paramacrobiotus metropolitanus]|uniref:glycine receptor subunit alpha-4-like isoform X2 n=1 Tax=Paramacrobiotus metropolitanus TaxID=2943436 RepID=UPI002445AD2C|nr:glycine receptor subunit alpha-4-like isoform X2 [Paramacrobiotus metropolitanus]